MLSQFSKSFSGWAVLTLIGVGATLAQTPPPKQVKTQEEFNLYTQASPQTTPDPQKRLAALDAWKAKYPDTNFQEERLLIYLTTYQALGKPDKMVETAKEILAINPKEVNALYWLALLTASMPPTADSLATGEKGAQGLLDAQKPDAVKEADWPKIKADFTKVAHNTLAFIATQRKQPEKAEEEYAKSLASDPGQAQISYLLGNTILAEKKPERQSEVLYHWARAASVTGPGALPAANQKQVDAFFIKQYNLFHGPDEAGLKELRSLALTQPMPPAGFKIKNKNEIEAENQEKFAKENPSLALWTSVKDQLMAANGEQYFEMTVKGAALPGGASGVTKFKGTLISQKPALSPKVLVLGITKPDAAEVTLKLDNALPGKAEPGTVIQFEGVASAFSKEPFNLTFDVDSKDKIEGWPAKAPAPPKKRPSGTKKKQ